MSMNYNPTKFVQETQQQRSTMGAASGGRNYHNLSKLYKQQNAIFWLLKVSTMFVEGAICIGTHMIKTHLEALSCGLSTN